MFHQPPSVSDRFVPSILLIIFLAFGVISMTSAAGLVNGPAEAAALPSRLNDAAPDACSVVYSPQDLQTATLINFDDVQHATVIGTHYQVAHGVVFGTGDSNVTAYEDPRAVSIYNLAINEAMKPNNSAGKALKITFDKPVSQVGLFFGAGDGSKTNAVLTAFDQLGVEICNTSIMPVPVGISQFLGLKNGNGAQFYSISLDYGDYPDPEIIDDFYFSRYENPPDLPCPVTWLGYPASMNAGAAAGFTWSVTEKSYYSSQTYLVYDTVSHTAAGSYRWYQAPTPNSGFGEFATNVLAREAGNLYLRAGLTYQTTAGSTPQHCLSDYEVGVKVNPTAPTQTPPGGNVSGAVTTGKGTILTNVVVDVCRGAACQNSTSDKNGLYSIVNLAPGDYSLTAVLSGYDTFTSRVTIRSGQTTTANIGMRRIPTPTPPPVTGTVSGQVLDQSSSAAVVGASLELRAALGNSSTYMATTTADASGNFVFNGVPTGNWLVLASHRDYHSWFRAYSVAGSSTATGNISLRLRYRPPAPVPGAALDLSIANVMAFQASQRWDNSLQLAANRQTSLRGFVNLGSSNAADLRSPVEGYLYSSECLPAMGLLSSNITPLPVSDWTTSNTQRTAVLENLGATLNFNLPLACTTPGTRHFSLVLSPSTANPERNLDNNTHNFTVNFVERRPLLVNFVRISLRENWLCPGSAQAAPPLSAVWPAMQSVEWMFPTAVYMRDAGTDDYCASPRQENFYPGWWYINLGLSIRFTSYAIPSSPGYFMGGAVPMAYGLVDSAECAGGTCAGGSTPMVLDHHWVSSGLTNRPTTAPHEIGHARGLLHAGNSHSESTGGSWVSWPYPHGAFSQFGPNETWGYNPFAVSLASPQGRVFAPIPATPPAEDSGYAHELMSYGNEPRWLSDVNWNNLFYSFRTPGGLADQYPPQPVKAAAPQRLLFVGGVQRTNGMIEITAMRPMTDTTGTLAAHGANSLAASPVSYTLQLSSITGTLLSSAAFKPQFFEGDKEASFQVYMPYPLNVSAITILTGTQVVTTHLYTSQSPVVTIFSPGESGVYTTSLTLSWTATDPDGDALSYDIQYSADGGQTWQGLASMLPGAAFTYTVDLSSVPGSENAFFKILATDGLNTGSAITPAPLVIGRKPPVVVIDSIVDGDHFTSDLVISLEGTFMDIEDLPPYTSASFVWSSDRDGLIGLGQNTTTYGLTPGWHTITLLAADSDGQTATASVRIRIGEALFLPIMRR